MRNYHILLALLLIASPIYCTVSVVNYVTLSISTLSEQLQQDALINGTTEAESWGNDSSEFYKCSNLSNKYFSTISHTFTLSKTFTGISTHDSIYVTFDAVFLNIEKKASGITKNAKIDIDGTEQTFSAKVTSEDLGCMSHTTGSKVDGKTSVALLFTHSSSTMTVKITPTDLGTVARLGIANMKIVKVSCGDNASYAPSSNSCVCNTGYKQTTKVEGRSGHVVKQISCTTA